VLCIRFVMSLPVSLHAVEEIKPVDLESQKGNQCCSPSRRDKLCMAMAYCWFGLTATVVAEQFSDQDFSAVLTLSAGVQCFGLLLLVYKVATTKTVSGLSARSLEMYVVFFLFRLSSSMFKNGYIPVDRSGDWVYQATDIVSLLLTLQLLYCIHVTHRSTYQAKLDTVEMWRTLPACVLVATFVHGDLNDSPFFDVVWTVSLVVDTVALIPQLWMVYQLGEAQGDRALSGLNAHYVAAMVGSRFLAFWFWFHGFPEIAPLNGGANVAGYLIIGCHSLQLLVSADFMLQYLKAAWKKGQEVIKVLDEQ